MDISKIPVGANAPEDINVVIEVPQHADPIKYELDKESGAVFVDRFMHTAMHYPCNYGFVPNTLSDDGDPVDVLVVSQYPLIPGCVIPCRPVGVLQMEDEAGLDAKILAVPASRLKPYYCDVKGPEDLPAFLIDQIKHFFEHYKDLEKNKWVRVTGWGNAEEAKKEIMDSAARYQAEA
ncbi:inorganic pyrophosphatase [Mariprofundus ferrinatatus]|uniref:Inorganic pyrophosphatase n=1 Tax=Mariprofundus ferrinatatus TaxID=1921087 RepID=A0A2K8L219_9PROT|nr:inorganic diphosphatase [Mariprofundus ferrinatatus]ATX81358.1 inorganic pyrophosphatase [Mariprofundus ferrinatatus]